MSLSFTFFIGHFEKLHSKGGWVFSTLKTHVNHQPNKEVFRSAKKKREISSYAITIRKASCIFAITFAFSSPKLFSNTKITESSLTIKKKFALEEFLQNHSASFLIKGGSSYYLFRSEEIEHKITRECATYSAEILLKTKSWAQNYQGVNFQLTPVLAEGTTPSTNSIGKNINSDISGLIINISYNISYRFYSLMGSSLVGWSYKYFYFGGGVVASMHSRWRHRTLYSNKQITSLKPGINAFTGIQFSFKDTPFAVGAELRFTDIFASPQTLDQYQSYKLFQTPTLHQQHAEFSLALSIQL